VFHTAGEFTVEQRFTLAGPFEKTHTQSKLGAPYRSRAALTDVKVDALTKPGYTTGTRPEPLRKKEA
jgi:hypothetical protein